MDIRQILELEANSASIKKIDQFLSEITPNHRDYPKALAHLAYLSFELGNVSSAFQLLFNYLEVCIDKEKPTIYNTLIKIYYLQKDYDNVLQMIEAKKKYLPNYNKIAYYEDLITYYDITLNSSELIRTILTYLDDDLTDDRRLKALIRLCKEYLQLADYTKFNEKNKLIQSLALSLNEERTYHKSCYLEAYVLVKEESYPKALAMIDDMLEIHLSKDLRARLLALKLEILVSLGDYRRASIFEAEYEYEVFQGDIEAKLNFSKQCVSLYEALNNRFNKLSYEERYQALLEEQKDSLPKEVKIKKQRVSKQTIELNFLKNQKNLTPINIDKNSNEIKTNTIHRSEATLIESGSKLYDIAVVFDKLNKQVFSQFRDYLRQFFIVLASIATFDEAYFLTKNNKYYGYHYKKERLYEKKTSTIIPNDTILLDVLDINEEIIIEDTKKTTYKDIVSNKLYIEKDSESVISVPLTKAAIMFSGKDTSLLTAKLNYETIKLACSYLELKWNNEQNELYLLKKHHDYTFMLEHIVSAYKKQVDNYLFLSKTACDMFGLDEAISIDEFYNIIESDCLIEYKKKINDLINQKVTEDSVRFKAIVDGEVRHFQEDFKIDEDGVILSVINDISQKVKEEENALLMAHYDPISGLYNKSKLSYDIYELVKEGKFSLLAFNVIDFKKYSDIYGLDFADQLVYAIGKYFKEYDSANSVYYLGGDKFVLSILGQNDKRRMTKYAYEISNYLTEKLKKLNYRLDINFEVGILRYPTDTNETSAVKILEYLLSALSSANTNLGKTSVSCYSKEDYKNQFFQSQLQTLISESIDSNELALYYQQVVDVAANSCDHYYVSLNLSNYAVSSEQIYHILKKRNMVKVIERYIIHKALFELEEMYKQTKLYFNLSFKVSYVTLVDDTFKDYLLEQLKFFNIPKTAITICYNDEVDDLAYEVLKSLTVNQILISSTNIEVMKHVPLYYLYYKLPKDIKNIENEFILLLKDYCDKRNTKFVLDQVNNKELIAHFAPHGINLYSGKIYSALLSHIDIIHTFIS